MTEPPGSLDVAQTRAQDGRTMIGHVVVCPGTDERGADVVAVWHVNTAGTSTGAWVFADADAAAHGVLDRCARRALAAWDPTAAVDTLRAAERSTGAAPRDWLATAVVLPTALAEIAAVRCAVDQRIAEERQVKKAIVPAEWVVDIPDPVPATADELLAYARLVPPGGGVAIREALLTATLLRWSVARWKETMTVVGRREYLQRSSGLPRALPPDWETRLAEAYAG